MTLLEGALLVAVIAQFVLMRWFLQQLAFFAERTNAAIRECNVLHRHVATLYSAVGIAKTRIDHMQETQRDA